MPENEPQNKIEQNRPTQWSVASIDEEARRNLFGFFDLLIKVDRRVNPQLYQKQNDDN